MSMNAEDIIEEAAEAVSGDAEELAVRRVENGLKALSHNTRSHDPFDPVEDLDLSGFHAETLDEAVDNAYEVIRRVDADFADNHPMVAAEAVSDTLRGHGGPIRLVKTVQDLINNMP